jgi:hypothetical protein
MADLFTLYGRIAINAEEANKKIDKVSFNASGLAKTFKNIEKKAVSVGKTVVKGATAGAAALGVLAKASISGYAEYEQLVGGVETLFGASGQSLEEYAESVGKSVDEVEGKYNQLMNAQSTVFANAQAAYKNTGYSANQYMQMATLFSASLISNLKGDTEKAAGYTDLAISDMADNVSKMGTNVEDVQNAYKGFAKGTYDMLDNLRIGYSGGKTEMQRLLKDAQKLSGKKYNIKNLTDIIEAIHVIQEEMGIAGNAEAEAATTISGSINSTKAAWENLVMGLADGNADIDKLFGNLTASAKNVVKNVGKLFPGFLKNVGSLIRGIGSTISDEWANTVYPIIQEKFKAKFNIELPDWDDVSNTITTKMAEIQEKFAPVIESFSGWIGENKEQIGQLVSSIGDVAAGGLDAFLGFLEWTVENGDTVKAVLKTVALAFIACTAAAHPYITAIVALVAAMESWKNGEEKMRELGVDVDKINSDPLGALNDSATKQKESGRSLLETLTFDPAKVEIEPTDDSESNMQSDIDGFDLNGKALVEADPESKNALQSFLDNLSLKVNAVFGISDSEGGGGHFARGLPRVPYDGFKARLHENEAVLTASQAAIWRGERMPSLAGIGALTTPAQTEQPVNLTINISGNTNSPYEVAQAVRNAVDDWRWRG